MKKIILLLLVALALSGCRSAELKLGDFQVRPADQMVMVYLPSGEFTMGSDATQVEQALALCGQHRSDCQRSMFEDEEPAHSVFLDAFWIDLTEVTNAQYRLCVEAGACQKPGCWDKEGLNADNQPVVCTTWVQAQAYCQWAGGDLPTEAQWEYAARGTQGWLYPWGNEFDGSRLNYCDTQCQYSWADKTIDDGYAQLAPVGSFPTGVSWCGALDMAGNAWEWVYDMYGTYPAERQVNPMAMTGAAHRVLRGGAYDLDAAYTRTTIRNWGIADRHSPVSGFRCALPVE